MRRARIIVGNSKSVSATDARSSAIFRALMRVAEEYDAAAVASTECADFAARAPGWSALQAGPIGSPQSALAALVRDGVPHTARGLRAGTAAAWSARGSTRARPFLRLTVKGIPVTVCHAPWQPATSRYRYLGLLRTLGGVKVGDLNVKAPYVRRLLPDHRVHSDRLMHVAVPRIRFTSTVVAVIDRSDLTPHADHEALVVDIERRRFLPRRKPRPTRPRRRK